MGYRIQAKRDEKILTKLKLFLFFISLQLIVRPTDCMLSQSNSYVFQEGGRNISWSFLGGNENFLEGIGRLPNSAFRIIYVQNGLLHWIPDYEVEDKENTRIVTFSGEEADLITKNFLLLSHKEITLVDINGNAETLYQVPTNWKILDLSFRLVKNNFFTVIERISPSDGSSYRLLYFKNYSKVNDEEIILLNYEPYGGLALKEQILNVDFRTISNHFQSAENSIVLVNVIGTSRDTLLQKQNIWNSCKQYETQRIACVVNNNAFFTLDEIKNFMIVQQYILVMAGENLYQYDYRSSILMDFKVLPEGQFFTDVFLGPNGKVYPTINVGTEREIFPTFTYNYFYPYDGTSCYEYYYIDFENNYCVFNGMTFHIESFDNSTVFVGANEVEETVESENFNDDHDNEDGDTVEHEENKAPQATLFGMNMSQIEKASTTIGKFFSTTTAFSKIPEFICNLLFTFEDIEYYQYHNIAYPDHFMIFVNGTSIINFYRLTPWFINNNDNFDQNTIFNEQNLKYRNRMIEIYTQSRKESDMNYENVVPESVFFLHSFLSKRAITIFLSFIGFMAVSVIYALVYLAMRVYYWLKIENSLDELKIQSSTIPKTFLFISGVYFYKKLTTTNNINKNYHSLILISLRDYLFHFIYESSNLFFLLFTILDINLFEITHESFTQIILSGHGNFLEKINYFFGIILNFVFFFYATAFFPVVWLCSKKETSEQILSSTKFMSKSFIFENFLFANRTFTRSAIQSILFSNYNSLMIGLIVSDIIYFIMGISIRKYFSHKIIALTTILYNTSFIILDIFLLSLTTMQMGPTFREQGSRWMVLVVLGAALAKVGAHLGLGAYRGWVGLGRVQGDIGEDAEKREEGKIGKIVRHYDRVMQRHSPPYPLNLAKIENFPEKCQTELDSPIKMSAEKRLIVVCNKMDMMEDLCLEDSIKENTESDEEKEKSVISSEQEEIPEICGTDNYSDQIKSGSIDAEIELKRKRRKSNTVCIQKII